MGEKVAAESLRLEAEVVDAPVEVERTHIFFH